MNFYVVGGYVVGGICVLIVYISIVAYMAKHDVDNAPKAEMYVCDVHGPMPVGATICLFNGDMDYKMKDGRTVRGQIRACPICFEQKIKLAKDNVRPKV